MKMFQTLIGFPPNQLEALDRLKVVKNASRAVLVREAIDLLLQRYGIQYVPDQTPERKVRKPKDESILSDPASLAVKQPKRRRTKDEVPGQPGAAPSGPPSLPPIGALEPAQAGPAAPQPINPGWPPLPPGYMYPTTPPIPIPIPQPQQPTLPPLPPIPPQFAQPQPPQYYPPPIPPGRTSP
jgi:hypothetical protein